jgi:predicted neutral ceramidase superfamily lipid hydrolase
MSQLFLRLLDIMRLRSGPQDLPAGWGIAVLLSLAYLAEGLMADRALDGAGTAPRSLIAVSIQFLAVAGLLTWRHMSNRLPQTLTALSGTGLMFGALSILLVVQAEPGSSQPLLALLWLATFAWSLVVDAHVYRRALSITMSLGILIAVLLFALNFIVMEMLFPV